MSRARRLRALERVLGREAEVTWQEAYAAWDRIQERLYAKVSALTSEQEPPARDEAADASDAEVLRRWRRQRGIAEPDPEESRTRLLQRFQRIEQSLTREAL